jgi:hypothetical protein
VAGSVSGVIRAMEPWNTNVTSGLAILRLRLLFYRDFPPTILPEQRIKLVEAIAVGVVATVVAVILGEDA